MVGVMKKLGKHRSYAYLTLRILLGIILIAHGYGKLWGGAPGWEAWTGMVTTLGFPFPIFTAYFVGFAELIGGAMIMLGLFTRYAAALLAGVMLVAILTVKLSKGLIGGYELDLGLLAGFITLMFTGAGKISLDRKWLRNFGVKTPKPEIAAIIPAVSVAFNQENSEPVSVSEESTPSPAE